MKSEVIFYHTSTAAGNEVVGYTATSTFTTVGIDLSDWFGSWSVQISRSASDGSPTATIEVSNDGSNWRTYNDQSTSFNVTNGEVIIDGDFQPRYMRIAYTATGSPTGTITMKFYYGTND